MRLITTRGRLLLLLAVLPLLGLTASAASAQSKAPLKIGVLSSYTGPAMPYTLPEKDGMLLAVEEINAAGGLLGRPIELVFRDDKMRPDLGLTNIQEIVHQEKVELILGPFTSGVPWRTRTGRSRTSGCSWRPSR
jgi:branched-chain amino acid transport system substrate-binding protein